MKNMPAEKQTSWAGSELRGHPELYTLDATSLHIPDVAGVIFEGMTDVSEDMKNSPEYAELVAGKLAEFMPDAKALADNIHKRLDADVRFTIVDGLGFERLDPKTRDAFVLAFCALVGKPTQTDRVEKKVLWDVTPREYLDHNVTTFSEHSGEAAFHTDSQFFPHPEKYFSLWSLKHAEDGGGLNGLIDGRMITRKLVEDALGIDSMIMLTATELPFRVPTVFTEKRRDDMPEVLMRPIFSPDLYLRYRKDTLEKGLVSTGMHVDHKIRRALDKFESILQDEDLVLHHFLKSGQVLFANNHELLHNRSSFIDQKRHLLRVRMNDIAG